MGPYAGFLTITAVLMIQALFFTDGGLLALGCNIFNIGFFACFVAYPLIFKPIFKKFNSVKGIIIGSILGGIISLQLGALSVVLQTFFSGITELSFGSFILLMQPIHLAIGIVEGIATATIAVYVFKMRPEIINKQNDIKKISSKRVIITIAIIAVITGGLLSLFASSLPDGLEWSIQKAADGEIIKNSAIHSFLANIQEKLSFLPNYSFSDSAKNMERAGKSTSGIIGGLITLTIVSLIGLVISIYKKKTYK